MSEPEKPDLTALTVQLLSAYVGNNAVPSNELAELIRATRAALSGDDKPAVPPQPEYIPAVSVRTSLASRDHIISLIDGKPYKSLKRHLATHGLTPADYRSRYNLPDDYPLVAPNYSQQRREVAKLQGLGRRKTETAPPPPEEPAAVEQAPEEQAPQEQAPVEQAAPKRRGRAKAASAAPAAPAAAPRTKRAGRGKAATASNVAEPVE
ncbi:MucR family transcriptional regulator [Pseudochelatococcus sp. B33]